MTFHRLNRIIIPLCVLLGTLSAADLQPFRLPWNDASTGITSLQDWQPAPAGSAGWVQVTPEGHYAVGGAPIRFLGVNCGAASAMPTHALAEAHAARLARFGFNAVRFHHLEAPWDKPNILIDYASGSSRQLSAARLDLLHYFVAQLAARGIYSNLNLLVSREFQASDGLGPEITQLGWKDQHILGFFNDTALALHREYANQLLTAPNPYRNNTPLGLDPAVAFVEIMNENGLMQKWFDGVLDTMPAVYRSQLQAKWNQWLATRYTDTAALLTGWGAINQPLGTSLLTNGTFASGLSSWNTEQHDVATATFTGTNDYNGTPSARINVTRAGTASWHIQLNQAPLALAANGYYTITFWAKAESALPLSVAFTRAYGDYGTIGSRLNTTLTTTWQKFTLTTQNGATETNARINFNGFGDRLGNVWLADVKVQPGGQVGGLPDGITLEAANVPNLLRNAAGSGYTLGQRLDWTRFILSLETAYWNTMYAHLKTTLAYPGIVWGTIIANSPPNTQAGLDAIDSHSYWQHPTFPANSDWDPVNWTVNNLSMVNSTTGGGIGGIARQRVKGKPHNVTEYQHPSPNSYTSEGPLLAAAYASLQDWDSLWMFAYETTQLEYVPSFFDHGTHPGRMVNNLLAAALFRRGDVAPAINEYTMAFTPEIETTAVTTAGAAWSVGDGSHLGVPSTLALVSRLSLSLGTNATGLTTPPAAPGGSTFISDTGELRWDSSRIAKGVVTINTAKTKAVVGFTDARTWNLGGVQIAPGTTRLDWNTIGLTLIEGSDFTGNSGGRALLVATGDCENTGQIWKDGSHNSVGANWGTAPTLVETVPATLTLPVAPERVTAWSLDGLGQRLSALTVSNASGQAQLTLGVNGTTLWYEIAISAPPVITAPPTARSVHLGTPATFTVTATGYPAPTYQWLKDGTPISGATGNTYTIASTTSTDAGNYSVIATNSLGSTPSAAATLTLTVPSGFDVAGYYARNNDVAAAFGSDHASAWLHFWNYGLAEGRQFDSQFIVEEYLLLNTDLTNAFGADKQAALLHWLTWGKPIEDRIGRVPIGFNVDDYLARYPDLAAAFGSITPRALRNVTVWNHYVDYGVREGRSDGDFEAYGYLAGNSDLAAVFGSDVEAAAWHWYFYGRREGRRIPGNFDVNGYRTRNPDVVVVWGNDKYGCWLHYRDVGVYENRVFDDLFRVLEYRARYSDVQAAYGNNLTGVLNHWLFYGKPEGRLGRNP